MSVHLRNLGTTAQFLPQIKRAVERHIDGRSVILVPDTSRSGSNGEDTGGVGKFFLYTSTDSSRTAWQYEQTHVPLTVDAMSSTKKFVGSMCLNSDGDIFIAYQGVDNSLKFVSFNWTSVWGLGSTQTVVAANAVTDRFRSIDISCADSSTGNPAIIVYESLASSGVGAYARVYIRLNDGTTWRKAYETQLQTSGTILIGSEDVSVSYGADGVVSNVARLAIYYTQTSTTIDSGDTIREIDFNVSTGTDGSATTIITWATAFNQNVAAGSRKAWLFKNKVVGGTACWVIGGFVGLSSPFMYGQKLHHNTVSPTFFNKTSSAPSQITTGKFAVFTATDRASYSAVSASFADQRLLMSFAGVGAANNSNALRCALFRWDDTVEGDTCTSIDLVSRVLDNNYTVLDGSLAVYGGSNRPSVGNFEYTEAAWYGAGGDSVSATVGVLARYARAITEDTLPAPTVTLPSAGSTVTSGTPTFKIFSPAITFWPSSHGKVELQFASDSGFTTALASVAEADSSYRVYESTNGGAASAQYYINVTIPQASRRTTGTWYVRARILDDFGGSSAYSAGVQFIVSHPPAALPSGVSTVDYQAGDMVFNWGFSDPDPVDTQTAYQIILVRTDTGATVTDTGKITSTVTAASINVSSSLRDIPLSWKVRLWDGDNNPGAYSNALIFTLSDPPVVVITAPTLAQVLTSPAPTVTWTFSAGGRAQTHYRVVIVNTATSVTVADTGWVASAVTSYSFQAPVLALTGSYSVSVSVRDSAGLSTTSETTLIGNGTFENATTSGWTATNCTLAASTTQKHAGAYSLRMTPAGGSAPSARTSSYRATAGHDYTAAGWFWSAAGWTSATITIDWRDVSDASISTTTTTVALGASSWTQLVKTATAPVGTTQARVIVALTGTPTAGDLLYVDDVTLSHVPLTFTTSITAPNNGDTGVVSDKFKATISWTNANQDSGFTAWRLYRRYNKKSNADLDVDNTRNTWVLIYETTTVTTSYQYRDYTAPMNKSVDYAITQVADRGGQVVESALPSPLTTTLPGDRYFFVPAVPIGSIASFEASNVTNDSFLAEIEQETLHVIGRGRQVQVGDDLGYDGSLTIKLRSPTTARSDREFIELLAKSVNGACYIRSPFGDVLYVRFGPPSFDRMAGVGVSDLGDLTVPYVEVYTDAPITRTV